MKLEIKSRFDKKILYADESESLRVLIEAAIKSRANLTGADLTGANLRVANLREANLTGATMPLGEKWEEYLKAVVPALLMAGGHSLENVATPERWECHSWDNCPMAAAFDVNREEETPLFLRCRVREFVQLHDAGLIQRPQV